MNGVNSVNSVNCTDAWHDRGETFCRMVCDWRYDTIIQLITGLLKIEWIPVLLNYVKKSRVLNV